MATITPRGNSWQARIRRRGWPHQAKTCDTKAEAEAWARMIESEMDRGVWRSRTEAERTTLKECLERYLQEITPHKKGVKQERNRIRALQAHPLAVRFMATIRGSDMAALRDEMLARGLSANTVNNDLTLLSNLFNIAIKEWNMESLTNPVARIRRPKRPRGRKFRISALDEEKILAQCAAAGDDKMRVAFVLAIETGMRASEIAKARRSDVDWDRCVLHLLDTKNGEQRDVPLSSRAMAALRSQPARIDGRLVGYVSQTLSHRFRIYADAAGLPHLRLHDARHEATSRFFEAGLGIMEVAAIVGHKTLGMLQVYTHLRAEDLARKLG